MEESSTYQAIIEKGEVKGARNMLLLLAKDRLGDPSPEVLRALEAITDLKQFREIGLRMAQLNTWEEVLQRLTSRPRRKRRPS